LIVEQAWVFGLLGGLLIGSAGAIYLLVNGRILGPSSSIYGLWGPANGRSEQIAFLAGLIGLPMVITLFIPFDTLASNNFWQLLLGGLLVGAGTRLANGCTSGHGVCGMSRLSPRSLVATAAFVGMGMAVMALLRGLWGVI
jgi:uncharacterized membrane protein YedE/YeeE